MRSEFKLALIQLVKNSGFTTVAVLTLALGIGACSGVFSMVHAVLLKPLPFESPERLVWIENIHSGNLSNRTSRVDNFLDWREKNSSFEKLGAYFAFFDYQRFTLLGRGEPQQLRGVSVSQNFLDVLGVRPLLGRSFTDEESAWNGRKAAMLSNAFWKKHFDADKDVVGITITLNGEPTEIVGVLPASFDFDTVFSPGTSVQLLLPFPLTAQTANFGNALFTVGRLKSSHTLQQAQAEFDVISKQIAAAHPERGKFGARMTSLEDSIRKPFRTATLILFSAIACVLLIACVNLSNLLLARSNARAKEFASSNLTWCAGRR